MIFVETISAENIDRLAELSVMLWPDSSLLDMTHHYNQLLKQGPGNCFLLKCDNDAIGFVELSIRNDYVEGAEDLPVAYIEGIFVLSAHQQQGLGQLLITKAEDWAIAHGYKQLCSDTELENSQGINFHMKAGFTQVSRIVCFAKHLDHRPTIDKTTTNIGR